MLSKPFATTLVVTPGVVGCCCTLRRPRGGEWLCVMLLDEAGRSGEVIVWRLGLSVIAAEVARRSSHGSDPGCTRTRQSAQVSVLANSSGAACQQPGGAWTLPRNVTRFHATKQIGQQQTS